MAARRGKSQARRNQGNSGMPGWAWMILGILLTIVAILLLPRVLKSDGDGFFRPQPNPDAQPAPVAVDDSVVGSGATDKSPTSASDGPKYDFYTLLPGKEVAVSDAELAATERAEEQRAEALRAAAALRGETPAAVVARNPDAADPALPSPVTEEPATPAPTRTTPPATTAATAPPAPAPAATAAESKPVAAADGSRYLLQAGAFQASGQAEELKAQLAMMGLSARVEPAQINGNTVYRVRMGPYGSAGDLADAKRKLASSGVSAMAIKAQ
ncbi:SPOR domain-containing protein [Lysobacter sp. A03]|uniref:SPOR domain-containing protein n=1 Tax=Lysobacter sp. A03 TaxID=1199154 RepID=UPI0005B71E81|nr:SPOR domain-containing protein [Lysobacter sp. A03]KIQ96610.1 Cell division protein [Lysobacter sp. A03]